MTLNDLRFQALTALGSPTALRLGMALIAALGAGTIDASFAAPVAAPDSYSLNEDAPRTVAAPGVLANDTDPEGNALTATLVREPDHGMVELNPDGSFSYTPNWNFHGTDSFTYQAQNGTTNSLPANVTLTVASVNDRPMARADTYSVNEDTALMIAAPGVLRNDTDEDGDVLSGTRVGLPSHGTLTFKADGSFTYRPETNFHGIDSFTYTASDGITNSRTGIVTLSVTSVNDEPTAQRMTLTGVANTALSWDVAELLAAAWDADNDPLFLASHAPTSTQGGTLALADTRLTYQPPPDYAGPDAFTVVITDGQGGMVTNTIEVALAAPVSLPAGIPSRIDRIVPQQDGRMRIEFTSLPGRTYAIQYSEDLKTWQTATPLHEATASSAGWIDTRPTQTLSGSAGANRRFYRLFLLPAP